MGELKDKVAIVTGASSGIGLATAKAFYREGARLVITGRNEANLNAAGLSIGRDVMTIQSDASSLNDIDSMIEVVVKRYKAIDVMFLNVGSGIPVPFEQITETIFDDTINKNLKGAFFTIQKALPHLRDGTSIVLNSSMSNFIGQHSLSVYAAAKAGLRSLAKTLTTELGSRGIRFNVVSPGFIATPVFGEDRIGIEIRNELVDTVSKQSVSGRMGLPEEIAEAVVFLASSKSSYMMGSEIIVDGGYTIVR
jgi:NAD(P)-dependent dehydrogenase (short-subunit alcohol dehydrogenase family)